MNEENKCLKCGNELDAIDYTDLEMDNGATIIATVNGVCSFCNTEYYWHEKFKYTETYGLIFKD